MDYKQVQEAGDSSDSDVLDNWTILDTEEAEEATTLDSKKDEVENEDPESLCVRDESEAEVLKDNSVQFITAEEDHKSEPLFIEADGDAASDTDDGVSIITDSEPEELVLPPTPHNIPSQPIRRFSSHSNDYFDSSDTSGLHELPVDLGQKGTRKYVHKPNKKFNYVLNGVLVIFFASVFGLGVGHFLGAGMHEECSMHGDGDSSVLIAKNLLQKLETENDVLKLQLMELQQEVDKYWGNSIHTSDLAGDDAPNISVEKGWQELPDGPLQSVWNVNGGVADPDHPTEPADIVGEDSHALTDNLSKLPAESSISDVHPDLPEAVTDSLNKVPEVVSISSEPAQKSTVYSNTDTKPDEIQYPYSDNDLELIQTRYVKQNEEKKKKEESKRQESAAKKEKRATDKSDSFFNKMEAELNGIMNRVVDYSSNLVKSNNLKEHVATSIGVLSSTLQDMQGKVRSLSDMTAQHSIHAVDKVKKSVFKMVQNVKYTSENLLKQTNTEKAGISQKLMKSVYQLKDGLVDKWCHLKGRMAYGLGAREDEVTKKCRSQYKEQTSRQQEVKTQLHPSKSFKPETKKHGYVDKKTFSMKNNKNGSHYNDYKQKRYDVKNKGYGKSKQENKHKKQYKDPRFVKQEQGEKAWKEKCSQDESCNVTDGQWMERLAKGRADQRQAEHESDWLFDRAKARHQSRQDEKEDNWYIKRGKSRQHNREDHIVHQGYSNPWVDTRKL